MGLLSKLFIRIGADTDGAIKGIDKTSDSVDGLKHSTDRAGKSFKSFLGAAALGGAIASMARYGAQVAAAADQTTKFAGRIGISAAELQKLQFAASQTGVSANQLNTGLQRMTRRVQDAAAGTGPAVKALKQMGLAASDLAAMKPEDQFRAIADAMENVSDKTRVAFALFDSEGVGLINTMRGGADAVDELTDAAEEMDRVIGDAARDKLAAFNDQLDVLNRQTETFAGVTMARLVVTWEQFNAQLEAAEQNGGIVSRTMENLKTALDYNPLIGPTKQYYDLWTNWTDEVIEADHALKNVNERLEAAKEAMGASGETSLENIFAGTGFEFQPPEAQKEKKDPEEELDAFFGFDLESFKERWVAIGAIHAEQQAALNELIREKEIGEVDQMRREAAANYLAYEESVNAQRIASTRQTLDNISSLMNTKSRELFEIGKVAAISGAIIDTVRGATKALAEVPYPFNFVAAASVAAVGAANVARISSQQFGSKGSPTSFSGGQPAVRTQPETQIADITIVGSETATFSRDQVRGLIGAINEEIGDGVQLRTND